ncbi:MAG: hypothetical protein QMB63_05650 [Clostridiaceae bacterium]
MEKKVNGIFKYGNRKYVSNSLLICMILGFCLGLFFGIAFNEISLYPLVGLVLGTALGAANDAANEVTRKRKF